MPVRSKKAAGDARGRLFVPTSRHLWLAMLGLLAAARRRVRRATQAR